MPGIVGRRLGRLSRASVRAQVGLVLTESAWIVPSSKRSLTAALTRRCWSIRERPSNWGAVTIARRWSPAPVFVGDLDRGAGQRRLDHRLHLRQVGHGAILRGLV